VRWTKGEIKRRKRRSLLSKCESKREGSFSPHKEGKKDPSFEKRENNKKGRSTIRVSLRCFEGKKRKNPPDINLSGGGRGKFSWGKGGVDRAHS